MALTMNDLHTVNRFNSDYKVEICMNHKSQYFVIAKVNDVDHVIHTASGQTRFTRNLPLLVSEICEICNKAQTISIKFEDKFFILDNAIKKSE